MFVKRYLILGTLKLNIFKSIAALVSRSENAERYWPILLHSLIMLGYTLVLCHLKNNNNNNKPNKNQTNESNKMLFLGISDMIKKLNQKILKRVFTGMSKTLTHPLPQYAISPFWKKED